MYSKAFDLPPKRRMPALIRSLIEESPDLANEFAVTYFARSSQSGFHATIHSTISLKIASENSAAVDIVFAFNIPRGCYVDPYEVQQPSLKLFTHPYVKIHTYEAHSNPELIAEEANSSLVAIEFKDVPFLASPASAIAEDNASQCAGDDHRNDAVSSRSITLNFSIPVHLRYHKAEDCTVNATGYTHVVIPPPIIFARELLVTTATVTAVGGGGSGSSADDDINAVVSQDCSSSKSFSSSSRNAGISTTNNAVSPSFSSSSSSPSSPSSSAAAAASGCYTGRTGTVSTCTSASTCSSDDDKNVIRILAPVRPTTSTIKRVYDTTYLGHPGNWKDEVDLLRDKSKNTTDEESDVHRLLKRPLHMYIPFNCQLLADNDGSMYNESSSSLSSSSSLLLLLSSCHSLPPEGSGGVVTFRVPVGSKCHKFVEPITTSLFIITTLLIVLTLLYLRYRC